MLMIYLIDLTMNICNAVQRVKNDNRKFFWVSVSVSASAFASVSAQVSVDIFNSFGYAMLTRVSDRFRVRGHEFHTLGAGVVKRKSFAFCRVNYAKRLSIWVWFVLPDKVRKGWLACHGHALLTALYLHSCGVNRRLGIEQSTKR